MRILTLVVPVFVLHPAFASADPKYYIVLFGAQNGNPRMSHTWATFVKVSHPEEIEDNGEGAPSATTFTISWMPASGVIQPRLLGGAEPGRNFTLKESLDWCRKHGIVAVAWGPTEIRKDLYELALQRKALLESGRVGYRMLDRRGRGGGSTNCIHAVSDIVPGPLLLTGTAHGHAATQMVANFLRPHMIEPDVDHRGIIEHLELGGEEVQFRSLSK